MVDELKLCKDCMHFRRANYSPLPPRPEAPWCVSPHRHERVNLIYGGRAPATARLMRVEGELPGQRCGPEAMWFEPLPPPRLTLFRRITRRFNGG